MRFRPRLTVQLGLFDFLITGYCLLSPSSNLTYLASCLFDTNSCPAKFFHAIFCTSSGHFCFHQTFPNVTFANCTVLYDWLSWHRIVRTVRFRCFEFSFLSKFILVRMRCPCVLIKLIYGIIATWASRLISSSVQIPPNRGFHRKTQIVALPTNWHCNTQKRSLTLQLCLSNPRRSVVDFEFWSIVPISFPSLSIVPDKNNGQKSFYVHIVLKFTFTGEKTFILIYHPWSIWQHTSRLS